MLDPAWPKPLPNNWIIGDVGGIYVDSHDHIWVYHRPRALTTTDAGAQGVAGKDAKGPIDQRAGTSRGPMTGARGCCVPAPSVLEFDKGGNLLQAWGGPGDPGFLEKKCRRCRTAATGRRASTASSSTTTTSSTSPATARSPAGPIRGQYPWARELAATTRRS